jgi:cation-transporting ATPase E
VAAIAREREDEGRRVLALARAQGRLSADATDEPPPGLTPLGLVLLAEELRPNIAETVSFLRGQHVEIKVLSGDDPHTVAAIARDVGIRVAQVSQGIEIPQDPDALRRFAIGATIVGRIAPEGQAGDRASTA